MICTYNGCGEEYAKPIRGRERVTHKPVWLCPACLGRVERPTERGRKPRNPRRGK